MADLKLEDFVGKSDLQKLVEPDNTIERVRADHANAAKELAKGLKLNAEGVADFEKLSNPYNTQAETADSTSAGLTEVLRRQSEITQTISKKIEEKLNVEKSSAAELKKLTKANSDNAVSLEKTAKTEADSIKVQSVGNATRKRAALSEEERLKFTRTTIILTNQEVYSRSQAKEMNKQLQKAADVLEDTDENYIRTLARLDSTIGTNTDYIKRNSDRYSQQKVTIGTYREEVKAAWAEVQSGNRSMQNMDIIAWSAGRMLKTEIAPGLSQVSAKLKGQATGHIGVQAVVGGVVKMFTQLCKGIGSTVEFEFANNEPTTILSTTANNIKELTTDMRQLGATTRYTATQATELQIELTKLGFTRREILDSTGAILRFAQATGAELSDAAALSGAALRAFNASTKETEYYVSAMAVATPESALFFSYLVTALPAASPVAKTFNFQIGDTPALLGELADVDFDAPMSATAIRNILLNLADGNGELAKALGEPVKVLPELVAGLKELKEQDVDLNTTLELTDKRSVAAFNVLLTASDKIVPLKDQITDMDKELANMADVMSNNVKGFIAGFPSAWEALILSFYNSKSIMKGVPDFLARRLKNVATQLKEYSELQDGADSKAVASVQRETMKSDILEKDARNMQKLYKEYINSGMSVDEATKEAKKDYTGTLKSRSEYENSDCQSATDNCKKLGGELKDRGFSTTLTSWRRTDNVIENGTGVATRTATGKKAILSIIGSLIEQLDTIDLKKNGGIEGNSMRVFTDKEKCEQGKALKEKLKIHETYQELELALMDEGLEKGLARIGVVYSKKVAAVKSSDKEEIATRQNLAKEMQEKLDELTIKYNSGREKRDIENTLIVVKKGSQKELDLKLHQLELRREAEIDAVEKTGEDIFLVDDKYAKKKQELYEGHTSDQVLLITGDAVYEQEIRDAAHVMGTLALKKQLASEEITRQEYAELEYRLGLDYACRATETVIDTLGLELRNENLSAEDRTEIAEQLQKLKVDLSQRETEAETDATSKVTKADEKAQGGRQKNLKKWLQTVSQAVGVIGDLVSTIYDGQIQKMEEEQEANDEEYDRGVERIQNLAGLEAVSREKAEAHKRTVKERTEAKNVGPEKQKQEMTYKQAIWEKAASVTQTRAATALAVTEALPNIPLLVVTGAMRAIQTTTIPTTPTSSYVDGTQSNNRHPGGVTLVGGAGKHEVIMYSGKAWITPDTPTLAGVPKGAQIFPNVDKVDISNFNMPSWDFPAFSPTYFVSSSGDTIVFDDYFRLEKRVDGINFFLMKSLRMQRQDASNREFELCKLSKLE